MIEQRLLEQFVTNWNEIGKKLKSNQITISTEQKGCFFIVPLNCWNVLKQGSQILRGVENQIKVYAKPENQITIKKNFKDTVKFETTINILKQVVDIVPIRSGWNDALSPFKKEKENSFEEHESGFVFLKETIYLQHPDKTNLTNIYEKAKDLIKEPFSEINEKMKFTIDNIKNLEISAQLKSSTTSTDNKFTDEEPAETNNSNSWFSGAVLNKIASTTSAACKKLASGASYVGNKTYNAAVITKNYIKDHPVIAGITTVAINAAVGTAIMAYNNPKMISTVGSELLEKTKTISSNAKVAASAIYNACLSKARNAYEELKKLSIFPQQIPNSPQISQLPPNPNMTSYDSNKASLDSLKSVSTSSIKAVPTKPTNLTTDPKFILTRLTKSFKDQNIEKKFEETKKNIENSTSYSELVKTYGTTALNTAAFAATIGSWFIPGLGPAVTVLSIASKGVSVTSLASHIYNGGYKQAFAEGVGLVLPGVAGKLSTVAAQGAGAIVGTITNSEAAKNVVKTAANIVTNVAVNAAAGKSVSKPIIGKREAKLATDTLAQLSPLYLITENIALDSKTGQNFITYLGKTIPHPGDINKLNQWKNSVFAAAKAAGNIITGKDGSPLWNGR